MRSYVLHVGLKDEDVRDLRLALANLVAQGKIQHLCFDDVTRPPAVAGATGVVRIGSVDELPGVLQQFFEQAQRSAEQPAGREPNHG